MFVKCLSNVVALDKNAILHELFLLLKKNKINFNVQPVMSVGWLLPASISVICHYCNKSKSLNFELYGNYISDNWVTDERHELLILSEVLLFHYWWLNGGIIVSLFFLLTWDSRICYKQFHKFLSSLVIVTLWQYSWSEHGLICTQVFFVDQVDNTSFSNVVSIFM